MIGFILIVTAINIFCWFVLGYMDFTVKKKYNTLFGYRSIIFAYLCRKLFINRRNVDAKRTFEIMC